MKLRQLFSRTMLLTMALMLAVALPSSSQSEAVHAQPSRPNIVLILTDDQDAQPDLLGSMQALQTLLVQQGMSFSNFVVPLPLCCPARATLLRGQYSHNTGILQNMMPIGGFPLFYDLGLENDTFATALDDAGYQTALIGKYLNNYPNLDNPTYVPPGWDEWYVPITSAYGSYNYDMNENGAVVSYGNTPQDHISDVITAKAINFITRTVAMPSSTPFFVELNYYAPHSPAVPAPRHWNLFPEAQAPRTPNFNESDMSDKPPAQQNFPLLTPAQIASYDTFRRKQLQSMQAVDEGIAAVVQVLQDAGQLDNTYILFMSDNGLHLGQHRLLLGKGAPFEEDIVVPLIVRGPGVPAGHVRTELISLVDVAPTIADLAGTTMTIPVDGRSLAPLLHSTLPPPVWRKVQLLEHWSPPPSIAENPHSDTEPVDPGDVQMREYAPDLFSPTLDLTTPDWIGFRTAEYKFADRIGPPMELYHIAHDPYELYSQHTDATPAFISELTALTNALFACAGDSCRSLEELDPPVWSLLYHRADMNRDGQVNLTDVVMAADCWRQPVLGSCGDRFDMNYDAQIDVVDIMRIAAAWSGSDRADAAAPGQ